MGGPGEWFSCMFFLFSCPRLFVIHASSASTSGSKGFFFDSDLVSRSKEEDIFEGQQDPDFGDALKTFARRARSPQELGMFETRPDFSPYRLFQPLASIIKDVCKF